MKYISTFILIFFLFNTSLSAQVSHPCGTTDAEQASTFDFVQRQRQNEAKAISRDNPEEVPIKIHIIGAASGAFAIDSSTVLEEIELLNEAFEEIDIVFTQCGPINYIFSNTYVTFIKNTHEIICDIHDVEGAINIYIPPNIEKEDGESLCGYAYNFDIKPRVFLDKGCASNGSTLIHEFGHSFSLKHTHTTSNGEELANGSNCSVAGDLLCDTPADPKLSNDTVNDDCEYIGTELDNQQNPYNPDTGNFMSYSRKVCRAYFSVEQKEQMEAFYVENGFFLDCFDAPTPASEVEKLNRIRVFPNPSSASIYVTDLPRKVRIELTDAVGKSLYKKAFDNTSGVLEISEFHKFKSGIYFLSVTINNQTTSQRIIHF